METAHIGKISRSIYKELIQKNIVVVISFQVTILK